MLKPEKKVKIRNRLREIGEQKDTLIHNLNFVSEETALFYFETIRDFDRKISDGYQQLKSS